MNPFRWLFTWLTRNRTRSNLYDLDHAVLNVQMPPSTMWMNMGYWKDETDLPGACRALLDEVLLTAGVAERGDGSTPVRIVQSQHQRQHQRQQHQRQQQQQQQQQQQIDSGIHLVDVGIGCGDQSVYLAQLLSAAGGANSYVGITSSPTQAAFARRRVHAATTLSNATCRAEVFCADAASPASWDAELREQVRGQPSAQLQQLQLLQLQDVQQLQLQRLQRRRQRSWLLALDSMYHFRPSRAALLQYAYAEMRASVMGFDLVLGADEPSAAAAMWNRLLMRAICWATDTPFSNLLTPRQYVDLLVRAGYERRGIEIRDVTEHVFGGLERFILRRDAELSSYGMSVGKFKGAARLFGWWARSGVVRGVIVVARRE